MHLYAKACRISIQPSSKPFKHLAVRLCDSIHSHIFLPASDSVTQQTFVPKRDIKWFFLSFMHACIAVSDYKARFG